MDYRLKPKVDKTIVRNGNNRRGRSYGTNRADNQTKERLCKVCGEKHPIWACLLYKSRTVDKRWEIAKRYALCYHLGNRCPRSRECGISGCHDTHHRLLHGKEMRKSDNQPPGNGRQDNESGEGKTQKRHGGGQNQPKIYTRSISNK